MKKKSSKKSGDRVKQEVAVIDEWLDKIDLSENIKSGVAIQGRKGRPSIGSKISITLPNELLDELKVAADKRAIGYQTLIRMIVKENIKKYA